MVMVDNIAKGLEVSFIGNNNYNGGTKVIQHMVEQGYRKIGVILGDRRSTASNERFEAYKDVIMESGIPFDESIVVHSNSTFEDGYKLSEQLINKGVDSIFAINDTVAMGALKYCYMNNISVPGKLGVAGYDNIEQSAMMPVPLTTVEQNKDILGKLAAEVLMEHVKDNSARPKDIILEPQLVIRKSCGEN
jgi:LacI family transcriptional regulator